MANTVRYVIKLKDHHKATSRDDTFSSLLILSLCALGQAELDREVEPGRLPGLADRERLPYTAAVLLEIQRCGNIVPTGLHHMSSR